VGDSRRKSSPSEYLDGGGINDHHRRQCDKSLPQLPDTARIFLISSSYRLTANKYNPVQDRYRYTGWMISAAPREDFTWFVACVWKAVCTYIGTNCFRTLKPNAHTMSFEIRKFKKYKLNYVCILVTVIKLFLLSALFDQNRNNEHNIMDLRHYVSKENGDDFNSSTLLIVCYSTQTHNLHWNLYIYNWSEFALFGLRHL
jgi:hypothetical protein